MCVPSLLPTIPGNLETWWNCSWFLWIWSTCIGELINPLTILFDDKLLRVCYIALETEQTLQSLTNCLNRSYRMISVWWWSYFSSNIGYRQLQLANNWNDVNAVWLIDRCSRSCLVRTSCVYYIIISAGLIFAQGYGLWREFEKEN